MDRTRLRLFVLVIVHIVATIVLDQFADYGLVTFLLGCLSFSQIGLLAIGLVFGTWRLRWRLGSVVTATAALVLWQWHSLESFFGSLLGIVVSELSVAAGLLVARYGPPKLRLIQLGGTVLPSTRFQFSLRQVMALVAMVAVVLTAARIFRACLTAAHTTEGEVNEAAGAVEILMLGTGLCEIVVVSWIATWATLGISTLWSRITLALVVAVSFGFLISYCFSFMPNLEWYFCAIVLACQSLFTMASLLVVRSCGFRLIGRKEMMT